MNRSWTGCLPLAILPLQGRDPLGWLLVPSPQGVALGYDVPPLRGYGVAPRPSIRPPKALPWAMISRPFGAAICRTWDDTMEIGLQSVLQRALRWVRVSHC
jgi:hypothetical protein